ILRDVALRIEIQLTTEGSWPPRILFAGNRAKGERRHLAARRAAIAQSLLEAELTKLNIDPRKVEIIKRDLGDTCPDAYGKESRVDVYLLSPKADLDRLARGPCNNE